MQNESQICRRHCFIGDCTEFSADYEGASGSPMNMKLHYVLPHYHYLGNYFDLTGDALRWKRNDLARGQCGGWGTPAYGMVYHHGSGCGCFWPIRQLRRLA